MSILTEMSTSGAFVTVTDVESSNVSIGLSDNTLIMSRHEIERLLLSRISSQSFDDVTQAVLVAMFACLILIGAFGNGLVSYVVVRNAHMRTPRNIFIINLALSDLTLCLFTQPFNLLKILMTSWELGTFMCKFVAMFSGTNVFVSTISITAIALDRFQVIVHPTHNSGMQLRSAFALLCVWLVSFLLASPLFFFNIVKPVEPVKGIVLFEICVENPELPREKVAYSVASMVFQYLLPVTLLTFAHLRIWFKLKYRMSNQRNRDVIPVELQTDVMLQRQAAERRRKRRTNVMLLTIGVVFALSWLPLNISNITADVSPQLLLRLDPHNLLIPTCHLLVLLSACINPILYGWLNENFRREFLLVFSCFRRRHSNNTPLNDAAVVGGANDCNRDARLLDVVASNQPSVPLK